jgi:DNA-binding winged helix-turn-helix (wHTH) protein
MIKTEPTKLDNFVDGEFEVSTSQLESMPPVRINWIYNPSESNSANSTDGHLELEEWAEELRHKDVHTIRGKLGLEGKHIQMIELGDRERIDALGNELNAFDPLKPQVNFVVFDFDGTAESFKEFYDLYTLSQGNPFNEFLIVDSNFSISNDPEDSFVRFLVQAGLYQNTFSYNDLNFDHIGEVMFSKLVEKRAFMLNYLESLGVNAVQVAELFQEAKTADPIKEVQGLLINTQTYQVAREGQVLDIPPQLLALFFHLLDNSYRVVTVKEVIEDLWPDEDDGIEEMDLSMARRVYLAIWRLRNIIEVDPKKPSIITSIKNKGYQLRF